MIYDKPRQQLEEIVREFVDDTTAATLVEAIIRRWPPASNPHDAWMAGYQHGRITAFGNKPPT